MYGLSHRRQLHETSVILLTPAYKPHLHISCNPSFEAQIKIKTLVGELALRNVS